MMNADQLLKILNTDPFDPLVEHPHKIRNNKIAHAPKRPLPLNDDEKRVAVMLQMLFTFKVLIVGRQKHVKICSRQVS